MLLDPEARTRPLLWRAPAERLIDEHRRRGANHSLRLWVLLQLESWCRAVAGASRTASA